MFRYLFHALCSRYCPHCPAADDALAVIAAIDYLRREEGDSVEILCDNSEAESLDEQTAVIFNGEASDWQEKRFYAATWQQAVVKAYGWLQLRNG